MLYWKTWKEVQKKANQFNSKIRKGEKRKAKKKLKTEKDVGHFPMTAFKFFKSKTPFT